ncbi:hypothetical protein ACCUM_3521 [Candidatus Accumulibacter phosphatis]|uniref:Uncharacterized protein n=1 Tax=Candidatus Accumulibacter phosphatis TaxID=327160 RepID=A0A5S4ENR1_9PROT|nr:hypothetical protein ACCUM_3521 [Candidatus Accumulibacter phosphatis]
MGAGHPSAGGRERLPIGCAGSTAATERFFGCAHETLFV